MHLEIYGANLRLGGSVVTAAAVTQGIAEQFALEGVPWVSKLTLLVSPQMWANMPDMQEVGRHPGIELVVREDHPSTAITRARQSMADVRYVLFGPDYVRPLRSPINICGFADGTLIQAWYPARDALQGTSQRDSGVGRLRQALKRRWLGGFDGYVVQTEGMAGSLRARFPGVPVAVIPNLLSPVFGQPDRWRKVVTQPRQPAEIRLFYPAKGWSHKNHAVLPAIARAYRDLYGEQLTFVTTLTTEEFERIFSRDSTGVLNVGTISSAFLPTLFLDADALFMPSLNETFSSTPLEAAFMRKPLIVSDLPCFRDLLGGLAYYWPVGNVVAGAELIHEVVRGNQRLDLRRDSQIQMAWNWAVQYSDANSVAQRHLSFLRETAASKLR